MAGNDLKILITGNLNVGKSIGEINTAINGIEKKIKSLKVNIEINDKVLSSLNNFTKQMSKISTAALNTGKVIEEAINPDGSKIKRTYYDGLKGEFKELATEAKKTADAQVKSLVEVSKGYEKTTKEIEKYNAAQQKIGGSTTLSNKNGSIKRTINTDANNNVTGFKDTYDYSKDEKQTQQLITEKQKLRQELVKLGETGNVTAKQLAEVSRSVNGSKDLSGIEQAKVAYAQLADQAKLAEQMAQGRERSTVARMKAETSANVSQQQAINRNNELTRQQIQQDKELEAEIKRRIELYQKEKQIQAQNLQSRYGNRLNQTALSSQMSNVMNPGQFRNLDELRHWQQEINTGFSQIGANANQATSHALTFGSAIKQAFAGFALWTVTAQLIYAPVRALQDMSQRLIEIDSQMTEIRRVMDMPDFKFTQLLQEAVGVSDELSAKLTDVLSIMGDFGRMGFDQGQLIDITKTAQVLQNISDLDAKSAVDTLTSAMLNFNVAAKDSITIADQLNEVDNHFAVSTRDLSDGLRKAAATAKTFGVDMSTTIGYIAAIGNCIAA